MTDFLVFRIYAPLSSWGEIAVGETRGSWDRPSRSGVLGILGAGLGIDRDDDASQQALEAGYGVAVRADSLGIPLTDFHTTQTGNVSHLRKRSPATRREFLDMEPCATTMSRRGYQQDAISTIAVWQRKNAKWSLPDLARGLTNPHYVIFAGRKANALGAPLGPRVMSVGTLADAFASYPDLFPVDWNRGRSTGREGMMIDHDACEGFNSGLDPVAEMRRRDGVLSRSRWQFSERTVMRGTPAKSAVASESNSSTTEAPET